MRTLSATFLAVALLSSCHSGESSYTSESARVEEVLHAEDNGFRFISYIITWHGHRVVVQDVLARSNHNEGETIRFIASRNAVGSDKALSFVLTEF